VQVEPNNFALKAPGCMLLKLTYDGLLSKFAFKFNLRCYTMTEMHQAAVEREESAVMELRTAVNEGQKTEAKMSIQKVGRCRLILCNPC